MSRRTKYFTGLTIVMLTLSAGLAIPTLIEGINIGMNYKNINGYNEIIAPDEFILFNFEFNSMDRLMLEYQSVEYYEPYTTTELPVIVALMDETEFDDWVTEGYQVPSIANSTQYYNVADASLFNIDLNTWRTIYIIIYNDNVESIEIDYDFTIIPWGHIIATSTTGFLFTLFFVIFLTKIISALYFNSVDTVKSLKKNDKKKANKVTEIAQPSKIKKGDGSFCQSCGTPLTPKDGQYCPQCGASV